MTHNFAHIYAQILQGQSQMMVCVIGLQSWKQKIYTLHATEVFVL